MTDSTSGSAAFTFGGSGPRAAVRAANWVLGRARQFGWGSELSYRRIRDDAQRRTGLQVWGGEEVVEPLGRLVDAFDREAGLTPFGRVFVREILIECAQNRLRAREYVRVHPEVRDAPLLPALIVVGMPRTGTTLLYNLLCQDASARPLLGWESLQPASPSSGSDWINRRRLKAQWISRSANWLAPSLRWVHPFTVDGPEECTWLMTNTFVSPVFSMMGHIPSYTSWLWDVDESVWDRAYRDYRIQLSVLQHQRGGGHWVLKSPVHFISLAPLLRALPDSRIVVTRRDPREVVPSACSLFAVFRAIGAERVDPLSLGAEVLADLARGLRRMDQVSAANPDRVCSVEYRDVVADKVRSVRLIHEHFGLPFDPDMEARIGRWVARDRHAPLHRYGLDQFGISEVELRAHFPDIVASAGAGTDARCGAASESSRTELA